MRDRGGGEFNCVREVSASESLLGKEEPNGISVKPAFYRPRKPEGITTIYFRGKGSREYRYQQKTRKVLKTDCVLFFSSIMEECRVLFPECLVRGYVQSDGTGE